MGQIPGSKGTSGNGKRSTVQAGADKPKMKLHSSTSEHVAAALFRLHDRDDDSIERILAAGLLLRVRDLLYRELDRILKPYGTSLARFQILAIICRDRGAGLKLTDIAMQAVVHPTTLTPTIDRLVRDGLVERRPDPSDRRGVLAVSTTKGYTLYQEARAELATIEYGLAEVDLPTIKTLRSGLDKVAFRLEQASLERDTIAEKATPVPGSTSARRR